MFHVCCSGDQPDVPGFFQRGHRRGGRWVLVLPLRFPALIPLLRVWTHWTEYLGDTLHLLAELRGRMPPLFPGQGSGCVASVQTQPAKQHRHSHMLVSIHTNIQKCFTNLNVFARENYMKLSIILSSCYDLKQRCMYHDLP